MIQMKKIDLSQYDIGLLNIEMQEFVIDGGYITRGLAR